MPRCGVSSCFLLFLCTCQEYHECPIVVVPSYTHSHITLREASSHTTGCGRLEAAVWHLHQELDRAGKPCLAGDLASVSWMWIVSTHLHRDLHWYLTASSSQGIYRSWHHNRPRLLCQTVHPWNKKRTTLVHPAYNQTGGGAAAFSTRQETRAIQSLAGVMMKAWNWEAPKTQCTMAIQTFQVLGFFFTAVLQSVLQRNLQSMQDTFAEQKVLANNQTGQVGDRKDGHILTCC